MKKYKKWTVLCGKTKHQFDDRSDVIKFIVANPKMVSGIKHYNKLTSHAIEIYKESLRLAENTN
jgi:hypothetical protein